MNARVYWVKACFKNWAHLCNVKQVKKEIRDCEVECESENLKLKMQRALFDKYRKEKEAQISANQAEANLHEQREV